MSNTEIGEPQRGPHKPGLVERAVTRLLMRPTTVSGVEALSPHFRLIDFEGKALKDCTCVPGQKIQVKLDGGLVTRTYTPIYWDGIKGSTRILSYAHGAGPGSDWTLRVAKGDERSIFGPRRSLDLEALPPSVAVFGDETSFGLAAALRHQGRDGRRLHHVFEVTEPSESLVILARLGIENASVIARQPDDAHLAEVDDAILRLLDSDIHFVLTGNARSIQRVHRALKVRGVSSQRLRAKVYWAHGKIGLD